MADPLDSTINTLASLLGLFSSKREEQTTTGGSSTTQTMFSKEAMDALLKDLMESKGGLASIASGQKTPGLYNSTTRQLMVNDLIARSAAEVAKAGSPTVTTKTPSVTSKVVPATVDPKYGLLGGAALLASSSKGKKFLSGLLEGEGETDFMKSLTPIDAPFSPATGLDYSPLLGFDQGATMGYGQNLDQIAASLGGVGDFLDFGSSAVDFFGEGTAGAVADFASGGVADFAMDGLDVFGGTPYMSLANFGLNEIFGYEGGVFEAVDDVFDWFGDLF